MHVTTPASCRGVIHVETLKIVEPVYHGIFDEKNSKQKESFTLFHLRIVSYNTIQYKNEYYYSGINPVEFRGHEGSSHLQASKGLGKSQINYSPFIMH